MIRSVGRLAILILACVAAGLGYARFRGLPLAPDVRQIQHQQGERQAWTARTAISLEEFVRHYETGGLVIDARHRDLFVQGHLNAPSIMNIPADEADYHVERVLPYQGGVIVLYCSSETCEDAERLWNVLKNYGFGDEVRVYHPGWEGIQAAKLPTATGPDPEGTEARRHEGTKGGG